jgi:exopolysaccharide biosynthesis polyprenyl glycosylphosphotransferase
MTSRAPQTAGVSVPDNIKRTTASAADYTGKNDRRQHKRQQFRKTSLSSRPSLFSHRAAWIALDFVLCLAAVVLAEIASGEVAISRDSISTCVVNGLPFASLALVSGHLFGLYQSVANTSAFLTLVRIVQALVSARVGLRGLKSLWDLQLSPLPMAILQTALAIAVMFCARQIWRAHRDHLFKTSIAQRNFLIVGADEVGRDAQIYLSSLRHAGYRFKGYVPLDEPSDNLRAVSHDEIAGRIQDIVQLAQSKFVDEIIFSRRPATPGVLSSILRHLQPLGISIRLIPSPTETLIDRTDVEYIGNLPTIAVFVAQQRPFSLMAKRAIDLFVAGAASLVLLPAFAAIAVAIKLQSPGPVLYRSKRVGHKGRVFTCFKFRTMVNNADIMQKLLEHRNERIGAFFKITNDPRVTTIGKFLRKYSLDELPQLWNVLLGDMSLVGPRPPLDSETTQYSLQHMRRLDAVPGITGLWQVKARQDPSFEQTVALDVNYINNWSLLLDFSILLQTVKVVVRGTGT